MMTPSALIVEGINLMFSGMGFVLVFLLILIWAIGVISKLINRFFPEPQPEPKTPQNSTAHSAAPTDDFERFTSYDCSGYRTPSPYQTVQIT